ncbi:MAG: AMP-binding protein [Actinobacteria bacterium]|nr:AMP-binding protein [Actinomycetota bacterium]
MTAATVRELVLERADDDSPGLVAGARSWSWQEHTGEAARRARWLSAQDLAPSGHVGVLLDNVPEFSFLLAGAALAGVPLVGLNPTRGDVSRDVVRTDCRLVLTDGAHATRLAGPDLPPVVDVGSDAYHEALAALSAEPPRSDVSPDDRFVLVLTSGTTGDPKAVTCSHGKIARQGSTVVQMAGLDRDDVVYCAMPMFHSNGIIAGWTPALASGATLALRDRFSATGFLDDVRRFGATYANYVGTPLSYVLAQPPRDDDADNPLQVVFGNEAAPADVERFASRFGCRVIEAYGSTEGGISLVRTDGTPPGAMGVPIGEVEVVDPGTRERCPPARFDDAGRLVNPEEAIGEMVNTTGRGSFEGYWADRDAERERLRDGWFWSGDLAFRDADGFFYFAGRSGAWLRVGGENLPAAPIERVLIRHDTVIEAAVYGVPDTAAGDRVMAALSVVDPRTFDADGFVRWLSEQDDLGIRWVPTYLRIARELPRTGTNKLDRATLEREAWLGEGVLVREGDRFRSMGDADVDRLHAALRDNGRGHLVPGVRH